MASDSPSSESEQAAADTGQDESNYSPEELAQKNQSVSSNGADVNLDLVLEVPVNLALQVGSTDIAIKDLVKLVEGSVVALDRESNEPMDVLVNGQLIAHGEIVIVDEQFGIRLTDVVSPVERIEKIS